jgi:putative DNA primase/helicase
VTHDALEGHLPEGWQREKEVAPPAAQIAASVGLGKTRAALDEALRLVERGVRPIIIATPTHDLNKQLRQRARARAAALGISASIEMRLGRDAIDPEGDGKAKMCLDLELVHEVEDVGLDAQSHVCSRKLGDGKVARCRFYDACSFQRQRAKRADIWFVSHAALGQRKPPEIGSPRLLIVDENPVTALLRGMNSSEIIVSMGNLATVVRDRAGNMSDERTALFQVIAPALVSVRGRMDALRKITGCGPVTRDALFEASIIPNELSAAARQAKSQIVRPPIIPGMGVQERREMLKKAAGNRALLQEARMYQLLRDFLLNSALGPKSGHVRLTTRTDSDGNIHEVWRLTYLARVAKGWRAPTLVLDATARPEYRFATRAAFPGLRDDLGGEIVAATPHLRIRVATGRDMSLGSITANLKKYAREVSAVTARELRKLGGGRALSVTNKVLADEIKSAGLPHGVDVAHYNALRGRDDWGQARLQISWGRTQASPKAVETIAGAITGMAVEPPLSGWYPTAERPLIVAGKVAGWQRVPYHPDPHAEAVRWQICEGETLQSERLRAVARTADSPAELLMVGCPVPGGLELASVEDYAPPGPVDLMLAAGGIALLSAPAAAKAYPEIFPNAKAASNALGRGGPHSLNNPSIKGMRLTSCRYRLIGAGRHRATALVDPAAVPDPRSWLEARLGPLACFWPDSEPLGSVD